MKAIWKGLAIAGAVLTVGTAVFVFSRPAAAKAAGAKAFKVSDDCKSVEIIDEEAAKSALIAAATIAFKGMDQPAIELIVSALGYAIPQCPINDYMKITGIPGVPFGLTIGEVRAIVGTKTVAEVQELAAQGGLPMPMGVSPDSPSIPQNPVNALLAWTTGGDYP